MWGAAQDTQWSKACKRMTREELQTTIDALVQQKEDILASGRMGSNEELHRTGRKLKIAQRIANTHDRIQGGWAL